MVRVETKRETRGVRVHAIAHAAARGGEGGGAARVEEGRDAVDDVVAEVGGARKSRNLGLDVSGRGGRRAEVLEGGLEGAAATSTRVVDVAADHAAESRARGGGGGRGRTGAGGGEVVPQVVPVAERVAEHGDDGGARARVFRLEATAMPESRGKGEEDVRDGSRRGGGAGRGSRLGRGGGGGEREDPGAIEGPLADGEEVLEYAPATRPLVPGLAVGGARDEAAGAEPAADRDAGPEPARRATHRGAGLQVSEKGTRRAMLVAVRGGHARDRETRVAGLDRDRVHEVDLDAEVPRHGRHAGRRAPVGTHRTARRDLWDNPRGGAKTCFIDGKRATSAGPTAGRDLSWSKWRS